MDKDGKQLARRTAREGARRQIQMSQWEVALLCAVVDIRNHIARQRRERDKPGSDQ